MINAMGIHYQLSEESQKMLALAMLHVFQIDENLNQIYVQDFILFTDMISLPEFLLALENGQRHRIKVEDQLLRDLKIPNITHYELLKSLAKVDM